MTEEASWQGLPTAMGFAAKQAIDALRRRNVATAPVLQDAGISERDLAESGPSIIAYRRPDRAGSSTPPRKRPRTPLSVFIWRSRPILAMLGFLLCDVRRRTPRRSFGAS